MQINAGIRDFWTRTSTGFQSRSFKLIWFSSACEHMGEWMETAALFWLVRQLTPSPFILALSGFARYIPMVVVSFLGGVVADRFDRKKLLLFTLASFALVSLVLWYLIVTDKIQVWHVIVLSLFVGITTSFNHPARAAIVPNLVKREQILNAISLDLLAVMGSRLLAYPAAGYILAILGVAPVIALRVLLLIPAIIFLLPMKAPPLLAQAQKKAGWEDLTEGLIYLKRDKVVLVQVAVYLIPWFSTFALQSLMPIFARDILEVDAKGYGWLLTFSGLGSIIALVGLASLGSYSQKGMLLISSGVMAGLFTAGFGASELFFLSLVLLTLNGITSNAFSTINTALVQEMIPDRVRGRIMSFREITMALGAGGSLLAGFIAEFTGVKIAMILLGLFITLVPLSLYWAMPHLKKM